jgi:hypothetical protein
LHRNELPEVLRLPGDLNEVIISANGREQVRGMLFHKEFWLRNAIRPAIERQTELDTGTCERINWKVSFSEWKSEHRGSPGGQPGIMASAAMCPDLSGCEKNVAACESEPHQRN